MFEALLREGNLWKRLVECIKELVNHANFDCSPGGVSIQAMDTSHVALVNLLLRSEGFQTYNCQRNEVIGINLQSLSKVLRTTDNNNSMLFRHEDDTDALTVISESADGSRTAEFQLKLMEIEAESMGIPDQEYRAVVSMGSADFAKICRDMAIFGETVSIQVSRDGLRFAGSGDIGDGFAFFRAGGRADERRPVKPETKREPGAVKPEPGAVKPEVKAEDSDDELLVNRAAPRSAAPKEINAQQTDSVIIHEMDEPVSLAFALRYLTSFSKASAVADRVTIHLARDSPCLIEYKFDSFGFLRYYLAPKVDDAATQ